MSSNATAAGEEHKVGDILVAVVRDVEHANVQLLNHQRARRDTLRRIPCEDQIYCVVCGGIESLDAEVFVIDKAMVCVGFYRKGLRPSRVGGDGLDIFNAATHAVKLHGDIRRAI